MSATPPLLLIAEGRRPRLRKAAMERQKELTLHLQRRQALRDHARPEWRWTHIPNVELRDARTAAKLKQMGVRRGWPDFLLLAPNGAAHSLELKRQGEDLSDDQEAFQRWCIVHGLPHSVVRSIDEALAVLDRWGVLRIAIARRCHA